MCELVPSLPPPPRPPPPPPSPTQTGPAAACSSITLTSTPSPAPPVGVPAMCSTGQQAGALVSAAAAAAAYHGLKVPSPAGGPFVFHPSMTQAAFDFHRAQLYDYNARLHFGLRAAAAGGYGPGGAGALAPFSPHAPHDPLAHYYQAKYDPRARFVHEEPKPSHSYIGLIAMAILASKEMKLVLADIYQWILDNYVYFRNRGPGWRNSIRHNLSLNDCFIKAGRSANGKGHYWAVHPANIEDFKKGDFRRRKAQRKVRRHMGLSVPDDEDSPSPPPPANADSSDWASKVLGREQDDHQMSPQSQQPQQQAQQQRPDSATSGEATTTTTSPTGSHPHTSPVLVSGRSSSSTAELVSLRRLPAAGCGKKRLFDVESLLAPETTNYFRSAAYDPSHPAAKVPRTMATAIVISPEGGETTGNRSPHPTDLFADRRDAHPDNDVDIDDENIDVEDVGDADDDVISVSAKMSEGARDREAGDAEKREEDARRDAASPGTRSGAGSASPRAPAHSPLALSAALPPRRASPADDPLTRPASRPGSRHSPPSARASPHSATTPGVSPPPPHMMTAETIRTQGAIALQQHHHPHHHHPHHLPTPRGPWGAAAGGGSAGLGAPTGGWRDGHPSAFHSTAAASGGVGGASLSAAWSGVAPHAFPLMSAAFPAPAGSSPAEALAAQQRWQETFSRMMARPVDHSKNNVKSEA